MLRVTEADVLAALPERLAQWKTLTAIGIRIELTSHRVRTQDGHPILQLSVNLINDSNERISTYDGRVRVPTEILRHDSATYMNEQHSSDPAYRHFAISEKNTGLIMPRSTARLFTLDYCLMCASEAVGIGIPDSAVQAQVWIENREFSEEKTLIALRSSG